MAASLERSTTPPRLLRVPYQSSATHAERAYLLYLPTGYDETSDQRWPVIFYLHGTGERGDGASELDYVLRYGPLAETWIRRRHLPFVIVSPQLPVFGMHAHARMRGDGPVPVRDLSQPPPPHPIPPRPPRPLSRSPVTEPSPLGVTAAWSRQGPPGGWQMCEDDLLQIYDEVTTQFRGDPLRVHLTGVSYGAYGSWYLAARHRHRFASLAPICGDADSATAPTFAAAPALPIWAFHGGRDEIVHPQWIYNMANALEAAGHPDVRLTVLEELGHNCWDRVYAGEDIYGWFNGQGVAQEC